MKHHTGNGKISHLHFAKTVTWNFTGQRDRFTLMEMEVGLDAVDGQ